MPEVDAGAGGEGPRPFARHAFLKMSDGELELGEMSMRCVSLTLVNRAMLEGMKAGTWFQGTAWACGLAVGLTGGQLLISGSATGVTNWIAAAMLLGAGIGFAGGAWHRRRAVQYLAEGQVVEGRRDDVRAELRRRGLLHD